VTCAAVIALMVTLMRLAHAGETTTEVQTDMDVPIITVGEEIPEEIPMSAAGVDEKGDYAEIRLDDELVRSQPERMDLHCTITEPESDVWRFPFEFDIKCEKKR